MGCDRSAVYIKIDAKKNKKHAFDIKKQEANFKVHQILCFLYIFKIKS